MNALIAVLLLGAVASVSASRNDFIDEFKSELDELEDVPFFLQKVPWSTPLAEALEQSEDNKVDIVEAQVLESLGKFLRKVMEERLKRLQEQQEEFKKALDEFRKNLHKENLTPDESRVLVQKLADLIKTNANLQQISMPSKTENISFSEWWEKIKNWFEGLGVTIPDKLNHFKDWAKETFDRAVDVSKPLRDQLKELALQLLKSNWESLSKEVVKEALEFFIPQKAEIGEEIFNKLIEMAKKLNIIPWEKN